jgi:alpha-beta hydrolase superfamily lysophospholipase
VAPSVIALAPLANNAEGIVHPVSYVEDGPLSKELMMPLYEWSPADVPPVAAVLAIHGLTLHGARYSVIGKGFAAGGFYCCAPDMRGFGRCQDVDHKFCVGTDCKRKVNMEKSYEDLVALAKKIKEKYPNIPLYGLGESLGTSYCIRLEAEHPDLFQGLILSGPTVVVNPLMFFHPGNLIEGGYAIFIHPKFKMNTKTFVQSLVSNDQNIVNEMLDDPLCRKYLTIGDMLQTQKFVGKTLRYAKLLEPNKPVLIVQASEDKCMVPHAVTKLTARIRSSDQTIRWLHAYGHILFETAYLRPATIDAVEGWLERHDSTRAEKALFTQNELKKLGAKIEPDKL